MKLKTPISVLFLLVFFVISNSLKAQGIDSTQIGKKYPYLLPIWGDKAYQRGIKLPLPHGVMINSIYNEQNILIENFEMAINDGDFNDLSDIIVFGPSSADIKTVNARFDTWIFPFLSVGGFYGQYTGTTTVNLVAPIEFGATSNADGAYWGFNTVGVFPAGPVVISADYSWTWSQNDLLNKPVRVDVSGIRVIKNFAVNKNKPDMFVGIWAGAQFQKLGAQTDGEINLGDLVDPDNSKLDEIDQDWADYMASPEYDALSPVGKQLAEDMYNGIRDFYDEALDTTIKYKFNKQLEYNWNMLLGGQWQIDRRWQFRAEYGFLKSKQSFMASLNYRFGI